MKKTFFVKTLKPGLIEYSAFLLALELLFHNKKCEDLCNEDMYLIETRLLVTALNAYQNFSSDRRRPSEFKTLTQLAKNKNIVFQKVDKGNTDFIKFHHEVVKSESILYKSSSLHDLVDKCIKLFLGKILAPKAFVSTVPKKDLVATISYLDKLSFQIRKKVNRIKKDKLLYCNIWFVFQTKCKISNFSHLNTIVLFSHSGVVFKFQCSCCSASYSEKTKHNFKVLMCEISALTGKRVKGDDDSPIKEHLLFCYHSPDFEDF